MPFRWDPREHLALARYFVKWIAIGTPLGLLACFISYLFSAHSGIYLSQRIGTPKLHGPREPDASLRAAREARPTLLGRLLRRKTSREG